MIAVLLAGLYLGGPAAQQIGDLQGGAARTGKMREYVTYVPEPALVAAGKRSVVEIHLVVASGYHVNSHSPKSELLIPTSIVLDSDDAGVKAGAVEYPAGMSFHFTTDPTVQDTPPETLDVYTGPVVFRVPVTATAGDHTLKGSLRYQACDQRACYPPKKLDISIPLTAR